MSTIFALASGLGKCGVSVIRCSGPDCKLIVEKLLKKNINEIKARHLFPTKVYNVTGTILDHSMAVFFPNPASFTGEDVLELHVHGSPAVISCLYETLPKVSSKIRLANPGEFSQRAFYAGKMGLRQVEGLSDLLNAECEEQRRQALCLLSGGVNTRLSIWRDELIRAMAMTEAYIDFSEDENIEAGVMRQVDVLLGNLSREIGEHLKSNFNERIRTGWTVVIAGRPNAGKSSLFNAIVGRKAAIVSNIPGTTRDILHATVSIDGLPVNLYDTAGLRSTPGDEIEEEGIRLAKEAMSNADLVLHLKDPNDPHDDCVQKAGANVIIVNNKADLVETKPNGTWISCKTGHGIDSLLQKINSLLKADTPKDPIITRQHHRLHLSNCFDNLQMAVKEQDTVIKAEYLRKAIHDLSRVGGEIGTEDILDSLFKSFCIGK